MSSQFPDELAYLEQTRQALAHALRESDQEVDRRDRDYREHQRYMMEVRHEIDPKELFQNARSLAEMDRVGAFSVRLRDKIAKLLDSPYFARIDFSTQVEGIPPSVYIGRFAFTEDEAHTIYDWRAPISGMFYDCEVGPASYRAPAGPVEGELTRKRQFRIAGGELLYCLESSVSIRDEVLQQELSQTSDDRMKTIIATIQREQNQIIRNEQAQVLVIQGVAGSGKTSIALHRIAYLLYRQADRLTARDVVIISPNRVFGDYISTVLPELGEEPVCETSVAAIAAAQLDGVIGFAPARDPVEAADPGWAERAAFKSTHGFLVQMQEYLEQAAHRYFHAAPCAWGGYAVSAEFILDRYRAYRRHPIRRRLQEVAEDVLDRFHGQARPGEKLPGLRTVARRLTAMFQLKSTLALYQDFYRWLKAPQLLSMPGKKQLEWEDVYPFLYFHGAFEGLPASRAIRHLVIDEMQDYTPVQYAVLDLLFPCPKTILGDYGQVVNPHQRSTLDDFRSLYPQVEIARLNTSYRSSYEIITFAKGLLDGGDIRPVERHGEPVEVLRCADAAEELALIQERIGAFCQGGYNTMGIILKTGEQAARLHRELERSGCQAKLLDAGSVAFSGGVSIASVRMAKGLEFDEVLIPGADEEGYGEPFLRQLLYIACTRAMHRLTLTCCGTPAQAVSRALE